jgi:hypothetical protein
VRRATSINVAGVLLMHGVEPLGTMRHERTGAAMLRFPGTAASQDVLTRAAIARHLRKEDPEV